MNEVNAPVRKISQYQLISTTQSKTVSVNIDAIISGGNIKKKRKKSYYACRRRSLANSNNSNNTSNSNDSSKSKKGRLRLNISTKIFIGKK